MSTDNPWKKRKSGRREFMPPSRALLAEKECFEHDYVPTFEGGDTYRCKSADTLST